VNWIRHQLNFLNDYNYKCCKLNWIEPTWVFNIFEFDESVVRSRVPIGQNPKSVLWAKLQGFVKTQLHLLPTKNRLSKHKEWLMKCALLLFPSTSLDCYIFSCRSWAPIFYIFTFQYEVGTSLFPKTVKFYPLSCELIGISR
jgi:hypothetical protein